MAQEKPIRIAVHNGQQYYTATAAHAVLNKNTGNTVEEDITLLSERASSGAGLAGISIQQDSLATSGNIQLTDFPYHNKWGNDINLVGKFESGNVDVIIAMGYGTTYGGQLQITSKINGSNTEKNLVFTKYKEQKTETVAHGITLTGYINVRAYVNVNGGLEVTLRSNKAEFKYTFTDWGYKVGMVEIRNNGTTLTDVSVICGNEYLKRPLWIFGASQESIEVLRWPYYVKKAGYNDYLINALSGRNSALSLADLNRAMKYGKPKYLLFDNSNDDTDNYQERINAVIAYCKEHGIIPIFRVVAIHLHYSQVLKKNEQGEVISEYKDGFSYDNSTKTLTTPEEFQPDADEVAYMNGQKARRDFIIGTGCRYVDYGMGVSGDSEDWQRFDYLALDTGGHPRRIDSAKAVANQFMKDVPEICELGISEETRMSNIERDFGQYTALGDKTITLVESDKRFDSSGELVDAENWAVGKLGAVVVGNTYELFMQSKDNMEPGTALFVAHTQETVGTEVKDVYTPLFSAKSTDIPASGYVCLEAMKAYEEVLVSYRTDVTGANVIKVRRYETKAEYSEKIGKLEDQATKAASDLAYTQDTLDTVDDVLTPVPDYEALPLLCGQPPILFGAGTPQEAVVPTNWKQYDPQTNTGYQWNGQPSAVGQQYINTSASSGGRYIAVADANMNLTWKNF